MKLTFSKNRIFRRCRQCGNPIPKSEPLAYFEGKLICQDCDKRLHYWRGKRGEKAFSAGGIRRL